jgi:hypothetical protein
MTQEDKKLKLSVKAMQRPGGYTVFAEDLPIAQFFESVSTLYYQSPKEARIRAKLLVEILKATGDFK